MHKSSLVSICEHDLGSGKFSQKKNLGNKVNISHKEKSSEILFYFGSKDEIINL